MMHLCAVLSTLMQQVGFNLSSESSDYIPLSLSHMHTHTHFFLFLLVCVSF